MKDQKVSTNWTIKPLTVWLGIVALLVLLTLTLKLCPEGSRGWLLMLALFLANVWLMVKMCRGGSR